MKNSTIQPGLRFKTASFAKSAIVVFFFFLGTVSCAQSPDWLWAKSPVGQSTSDGYSVAVDASGNTYVTGNFESYNIIFGSDTLTHVGNINLNCADMFLVKYDPSGNVLWAKGAGETGNDRAVSVAVDGSGNAFVTGYYTSSSITFGSYTLYCSSQDASVNTFIVKYDAAGNVVWAKSAKGISYSYGSMVTSITADVSGNAYVAGFILHTSSIIFGSDTLTNGSFEDDIFLAKYDASGDVLWAKSMGGTLGDEAYSVAVDHSGNVYITGAYRSPTITFGSDTLVLVGGTNMFLAKYDENGNSLWATSAKGYDNYNHGNSVVADASGNAYVTGDFFGNIVLGPDTLTQDAQYANIFLVKYDANGNVLWAKSAGGTGVDEAHSVAIDSSGNVYVTGRFSSATITFDSTTFLHNPSSTPQMWCFKIFMAKYNANGNILFAIDVGEDWGGDYNCARSVAVDDAGALYMTGYFEYTIKFGLHTLISYGFYNVFIAKYGTTIGITDENSFYNFSVFPNPTSDKLTVQSPTNGNLTILNINGQQLLQQVITQLKTQIDINMIPSGVYIVKIISEKGVQMEKFIKE